MKSISPWRLIRPYWFSEERWLARGLLVLVIAMNLGIVYINVRLNAWNTNFYNALEHRDWAVFKSSLIEFTILAFSFIFLATFRIYYQQMLEFRWRQWITDRYLDQWLGDRAFYRIERDHLVDNPDQRISEDLRSLATSTLALSLDLLSNVVTLISFIVILWTLSGALSFALGTMHVSIPGYMVWAAALYALLGSFMIHKVGRPLTSISYRQQQVEADFRFLLVRLRENAEQVAFYRGAAAETQRFRAAFSHIRDNWWLIMRYTKRLMFANSIYGQVSSIFPLLAASPRYFAGALSLGLLFRMADAFGQVSGAMSWFINSYSTLADWKATVNRLREFHRIMHLPDPVDGIQVQTGHDLATHDLQLNLPNGAPLTQVGAVHIPAGARWLISGPSGSGKSTLMRALAGLWPFGQGQIETPARERMMFLPQQSYLPIGTLKAALCYPSEASDFSDEACRDVLVACQLDGLAERLDESGHWENRLSPGEQQRLAMARALLQRPDYLFLDEASSALDVATERRLYDTLLERLPHTAIISVAHRDSLAAYHQHTLKIEPPGAREETTSGIIAA